MSISMMRCAMALSLDRHQGKFRAQARARYELGRIGVVSRGITSGGVARRRADSGRGALDTVPIGTRWSLGHR